MSFVRAIIVLPALIWLAAAVGVADTTDREHKPGSLRDEEAHESAWQSLLQQQMPAGGTALPPAGAAGLPAGLEVILKRTGCDAANPEASGCTPSNPATISGAQR